MVTESGFHGALLLYWNMQKQNRVFICARELKQLHFFFFFFEPGTEAKSRTGSEKQPAVLSRY